MRAGQSHSADLNGDRLRIFVIHASHNLTNHAANGDGLVAWGFISELAQRGHRIHAVTDKLDVIGPVPPNLTLIEIPRSSANPIVHYFQYILKVRALYHRISATEGIDVAHQMNPVVRGLSLALLGCRVPVVLGTYVGDWKGNRNSPTYKHQPLRKLIARTMKALLDTLQQLQCSKIVLATPHALSRVPFAFAQKHRINYLHHGVDVDGFAPQQQAGDPAPRSKSILFVGHLNYLKGAFLAIEAFRHVAMAVPGSELNFIGSANETQLRPIRELISNYSLSGRVTLLGSVSRSAVSGWLRACSVLCAPSFGEPYGQNVLEAMAVGKPVVGTSAGGQQYLFDADGGFQIPPGDAAKLADALIAVLTDTALAAEMGERNRRCVERRNAWAQVGSELEGIYRDAVASFTKHTRPVSRDDLVRKAPDIENLAKS